MFCLKLLFLPPASQPLLLHLLHREAKMSESSSKSSQPLASKQEKDGTEKRGRGRPRKQPPVSPGTTLVGSQVGVQIFALVYISGLGEAICQRKILDFCKFISGVHIGPPAAAVPMAETRASSLN